MGGYDNKKLDEIQASPNGCFYLKTPTLKSSSRI